MLILPIFIVVGGGAVLGPDVLIAGPVAICAPGDGVVTRLVSPGAPNTEASAQANASIIPPISNSSNVGPDQTYFYTVLTPENGAMTFQQNILVESSLSGNLGAMATGSAVANVVVVAALAATRGKVGMLGRLSTSSQITATFGPSSVTGAGGLLLLQNFERVRSEIHDRPIDDTSKGILQKLYLEAFFRGEVSNIFGGMDKVILRPEKPQALFLGTEVMTLSEVSSLKNPHRNLVVVHSDSSDSSSVSFEEPCDLLIPYPAKGKGSMSS
jgi:hypothetical protein